MFKSIGKHAQSQGLGLRNRLIGIDAIGEYAGQLQDFREPTTVILSLVFNCEGHRHG